MCHIMIHSFRTALYVIKDKSNLILSLHEQKPFCDVVVEEPTDIFIYKHICRNAWMYWRGTAGENFCTVH